MVAMIKKDVIALIEQSYQASEKLTALSKKGLKMRKSNNKFTTAQRQSMLQLENILAGLNHKLMFEPTRFGGWPGLTNKCPVCDVRPPIDETGRSGIRRWRWIAVHIATEHGK